MAAEESQISGGLVIDKPAGWTSHDVVNKVRRLAGTRRVGHLGTLDPIATGVLPLLLGRATRLAQFFTKADKRYQGVVRFGRATSTYDRQGDPVGDAVAPAFSRDELERALASFAGVQDQVPPPVSAKKIGGVPAYKLARQNKPVELQPVRIEIHEIELVDWQGADATIRVHCSSGTYVRSIAHQLGHMLGCGAFLQDLRRTASGSFDLSAARTLDQLAELAAEDRVAEALVPCGSLLPEIPAEPVDATTAAFIRQGRDFRVSPFRAAKESRLVKAVTLDGTLLAIGEAKLPNLYHPVIVL